MCTESQDKVICSVSCTAMATLLLSSSPGLLLGTGSRLCSFTSTHGNVDKWSKVGFTSCQAFGNATSLAAGEAKILSRKAFTANSVGMARCELNNGKANSLDIWFGRAAMVGFVGVVALEVATGKGVLESVGLVAPLPTVALGLATVIGAIIAFLVFRSANDS